MPARSRNQQDTHHVDMAWVTWKLFRISFSVMTRTCGVSYWGRSITLRSSIRIASLKLRFTS